MFQGYVINLNRHPQRLHRFCQHPDAKYFERFPAIDKKQLEQVGSPELFFNTQLASKQIGRAVTMGEIACTLSHVSIWQKVALNERFAPNDFVVIAEDDVLLDPAFAKHVHTLQNALKNTSIDLVMLQRLFTTNAPMDCKAGEFYLLDNIAFNNSGSALYMIKKSRIQSVCQWLTNQKPFWLADHFTSFCPKEHLRVAYPLLGFVADNAESDLENERKLARNATPTH